MVVAIAAAIHSNLFFVSAVMLALLQSPKRRTHFQAQGFCRSHVALPFIAAAASAAGAVAVIGGAFDHWVV